MNVTATDVAALRARTGAGMMDCRKALEENNNDMEKSVVWLREKGIASAAKKAGRIASEGVIGSYIHMGGKIGVLLEVNCETDFVAKGDQFKDLVKDISMHIAASNPQYVSKEEIPQSEIENERKILKNQIINEGKKPEMADKIVDGKINKYYKEVCLLEQEFVKDPSKTISQIVTEAIAVIGEKISVRRFTRYEVGEGMEKRNENLAEEVAKQIKK